MKLFDVIKKRVELIKDNRRRNTIKASFLVKDNLKPKVEITPDMKLYYKELREKGVVKIPDKFLEIADYINNNYFDKPEQEITNWFASAQTERTIETGRTVNMNISFSDTNLQDLFFNEDLLGIVYNYYQRQPYYRNLPSLAKTEFTSSNRIDIQGKFHLDGGLNQISFMLLTNDITEKDTHMQYALGSNNVDLPYNIDRFSWEDSQIEKKYEIYDLIGKKGTLFIFDAGNGFHRAVYKTGTLRKMLHLNITTGHSISKMFEHDGADFSFLNTKKDFVKETIRKLMK